MYKALDQIIIPYFGRIAGFYYGWTRGEQLKQAFWTLSMSHPATIKAKQKSG